MCNRRVEGVELDGQPETLLFTRAGAGSMSCFVPKRTRHHPSGSGPERYIYEGKTRKQGEASLRRILQMRIDRDLGEQLFDDCAL